VKNYPKGAWLGHVTHFEILGPLYINGTDKNRNFVFGEHNKYDKTWQPTPKIGRGQGLRPRPKSKIWDLLYNFWTDEATASRYYIRLRQALCLQTKKMPYKGVALVTWPILKFWNPRLAVCNLYLGNGKSWKLCIW